MVWSTTNKSYVVGSIPGKEKNITKGKKLVVANIEIPQCVASSGGVPGDHCRYRKRGQRAQDIYFLSLKG